MSEATDNFYERMDREKAEESKQKNNNPSSVETLGQVAIDISTEDIMKAVVQQIPHELRRIADAQEETAKATWHLVKEIKPWAERQKRENIVEQDPDYLSAVLKQVQSQRNGIKKKTKTKSGKKRK